MRVQRRTLGLLIAGSGLVLLGFVAQYLISAWRADQAVLQPTDFSAIPAAVMRVFQPEETVNVSRGPLTPAGPLAALPTESAGSGAHLITINAKNSGYSPSQLIAPAGKTIDLTIVTDNTRSCSRAFEIPALGYSVLLPQTGEEKVEIPPQQSGTQLRFTCSMGMYTGVIVFQ